jgi:hypothetical protein
MAVFLALSLAKHGPCLAFVQDEPEPPNAHVVRFSRPIDLQLCHRNLN